MSGIKNPFFRANIGDGFDVFAVDAGSRISMVEHFTIEECRAALALESLQKVVRVSLERRIEKLEYDAVMSSNNLPIQCAKRGCGRMGWERDLAHVRDQEYTSLTHRVCPTCGSDSYYKMTQRQFTRWKKEESK